MESYAESYYEELERAKLYKLFSSLFMERPTDEILIQIKDIFGIKFDDTLYEIGMDFTHFFSEPSGHLLPYESLYNYPLGEISRFWGKATEEVQKFYKSAGLMIDEEIDLIPDHLSVELLFMSYLIEQGLIEYQKGFIEKHLFVWVPAYCDEVQKLAKTTFYKEVAVLLREFILIDCEEFGIEKG